MGFDICTNRDAVFRHTLTERDYEYIKLCKKCPVKHLCGGWSVWSDARFCDGPGELCLNGGCRAICSRCPEKVSIMAEALGADNHLVRLKPGTEDSYYFDPILDYVDRHKWTQWDFEWPDVGFQLNAHADSRYQTLYTVSLKHLYYPKRKTWSPQKDLRERFKIPPESAVAITTTVHDLILDTLAFDLETFADELSLYEGVDFIISPNFSVYDNYPRLDNLFNIKRKFIMLDYLQERGLKVVPSVCFINKTDFDFHIQWMIENRVNMMLLNFQTVAATTTTREWETALRNAKAVQSRMDWPVQLIAYGAIAENRIRSLLKLTPHVTFIDSKSYRLAEFHKDIHAVVDKSVPVKDLFHQNCAARIAQIQKIKAEIAACPTPVNVA